jgi:hypothetical protein
MAEQNSKAANYLITESGGIFQLIPPTIDYDALRAKLSEATPEQRIAAAQHYIESTLMPLPDMTPAQLLAGAHEVAERTPDAVLVKNTVGNLMIARDDVMIGWLDLRNGAVHWLEDEPDSQSP